MQITIRNSIWYSVVLHTIKHASAFLCFFVQMLMARRTERQRRRSHMGCCVHKLYYSTYDIIILCKTEFEEY